MKKSIKDLARETLENVYDLSPHEWTDCHQCFALGYQMGRAPEWVSLREETPEPEAEVLWSIPSLGVISGTLNEFSYEVRTQAPVYWTVLPKAPFGQR